jgi:transposase InsO family protein
MIKEANPDFGVQRISDMLLRGPALSASPGAVSRVLHEAGYITQSVPTVRHKPKWTAFERARPNELLQTDIFTFTLKRTNRRVHLVAFMDDHSRFITSFALHASASAAMVIEAFERGIASYRPPTKVLTDNGTQYVTWRGKSAFSKVCERRGIKQIVSKPKHPQTLGKIERFWGTLWRDCVKHAIFADASDAERRIGLFIDYHNFQRPHQGIGGITPADRFFEAQREVLRTLRERVHANSLEIARNGSPKAPFYITGNVNG